MNFTDVPKAIPLETYAEALELYSQKIRKRATAVYQVGTVAFPGASDLDILVTVREKRSDNSQFFSAINRLPIRYRQLFLHEPFILPESCADAIRQTSHGRRLLIAGVDVLDGMQPLATQTERWCKVLESYRNFEIFLNQCRMRGSISARLSVAVASSMRYVLRDLDTIHNTNESEKYGERIDELRAQLLSEPDRSEETAQAIWSLFCSQVATLQTKLETMLPLKPDESIWSFTNDFLKGKRLFGEIGGTAVADRRAIIDNYFAQLYGLEFPYGYLFFLAAYADSIKRYRQPPTRRILLSLPYKIARLAGR